MCGLGGGGYYLLITKPVQDLLGKRILEIIANRTNTHISLSKISFYKYKELNIKDLCVEDQQGDTLLYSSNVTAYLDSLNRRTRFVKIKYIQLKSPRINIYQQNDNNYNFTFLIDSLSNPLLPDSLRWRVDFKQVVMDDGYVNASLKANDTLLVNHLNTTVNFDEGQIKLERLDFKLDNGFVLSRAEALVRIDSNAIYIPQISAQTPFSSLILTDISLITHQGKLKDSPRESFNVTLYSNQSVLGVNDLANFIPESYRVDKDLIIDGKIEGNMAELHGDNFKIKVDGLVDLIADFKIKNVLDNEKLSFDLAIDSLSFNVDAAGAYFNEISNRNLDYSSFSQWGNLKYKGNVVGDLATVFVNGNLNTLFGNLSQNLQLNFNDTTNSFSYQADIETKKFNLGRAFQQPELLGDVTLDLHVEGEKDSAFSENYFVANISRLSANGYNYHDIEMHGVADKNSYMGVLNVNDPNAQFDFSGNIDFSEQDPVYNFSLLATRIDLAQLNIVSDYDTFIVKFDTETNLSGKNIDDLNGITNFYELNVITESGRFSTDSLSFIFKPLDAHPSITLESDFVNAEIVGSYNFAELPGFINQSLHNKLKNLPMIFDIPTNVTPNDFYFKAEIDDMYELAEAINFPIRANGHTSLSGHINSRLNTYSVEGSIPYLLTQNQLLDSIEISIHNDFSQCFANVDIGQMSFISNHVIRDINLQSNLLKDTIDVDVQWMNDDKTSISTNFSSKIHLQPYGRETMTIFDILPSTFELSDSLWQLDENRISLLSNQLLVDSFKLHNGTSHFIADGAYSDDLDDTLYFDLKHFDLDNLNRFLNIKKTTFGGLLSGKANLYSILDNPVLDSKVQIDSAMFNDSKWGDMTISSVWDDANKALNLIINSYADNKNILNIEGDYLPDNDSLALDCNFKGFPINFIQPYVAYTLDSVKGGIYGHVLAEGPLASPRLYGGAKLADGGFRIDYISADFSLNDSVFFDNNRFVFKNTKVADQEGNFALVNGDITHTGYRDMLVDLMVTSDRFLALNNTADENEYFYGDIYYGGLITITSDENETRIGSTAKTMPGSRLTVPLAPISVATKNNFIRYIDTVKEVVTERRPQLVLEKKFVPNRNLVIDMNFEITEDALVRLESGDIIQGFGNGNLNVQFQHGLPFQMFGNYEIVKGEYFFSVQQIFNKRFNVVAGSNLRWSGKPGDAMTDITAQYSTKASLYNLMPDAIGEANKNHRVSVDVEMLLNGRLSQPDINFEIKLPSTNEQTQQSVSSIINTEEEMTRQVISLLIMNSFYTPEYYTESNSPTTQTNNQISSAAAVTASEFLSNQLSNWVSQISDKVDLGLHWVPGQELSDQGFTPQEYEMAISSQFFNDRLVVNSNLGYQDYNSTDRPSNLNSNFVGEIDVELKLNDLLRLKAYSRQNDDILYESSSLKQGVGITYQENFENVSELTKRYKSRIKHLFSKKNKRNTDAVERKDEEIDEETVD